MKTMQFLRGETFLFAMTEDEEMTNGMLLLIVCNRIDRLQNKRIMYVLCLMPSCTNKHTRTHTNARTRMCV